MSVTLREMTKDEFAAFWQWSIHQEAQAGCEESVLFVSNDNAGARALYEKCGYAFLRAHGYGSYMRKQL